MKKVLSTLVCCLLPFILSAEPAFLNDETESPDYEMHAYNSTNVVIVTGIINDLRTGDERPSSGWLASPVEFVLDGGDNVRVLHSESPSFLGVSGTPALAQARQVMWAPEARWDAKGQMAARFAGDLSE